MTAGGIAPGKIGLPRVRPFGEQRLDDLGIAPAGRDHQGRHTVLVVRVGRGADIEQELRHLDLVSYMRFASVYKGFDTVDDFERELVELQKSTAPKQRSE